MPCLGGSPTGKIWQVLEQYVNDTEDFINIDLDSHRNQLIEIDLMASEPRAPRPRTIVPAPPFAISII